MDCFFVVSGVLALTGWFYWRFFSLAAVLRKVALLTRAFREEAGSSTELEYEDRFLGFFGFEFRVSLAKNKEGPFDPHEDIYDPNKLDRVNEIALIS